jgi:hypothetical protein
MGKSLEEIAGKYQITLGDVHAAMAYYYDHRSAIDADMLADEAYATASQQGHPSLLRARLGVATSD